MLRRTEQLCSSLFSVSRGLKKFCIHKTRFRKIYILVPIYTITQITVVFPNLMPEKELV